MARPQSYVQKQVLNNAMQVFWRKGYTTTSIKDLTQATKLQPGSLYGAFKNKRNLFIASLDYYFIQLYQEISCILQAEEKPLRKIRQYFDYVLKRSIEDNENKSCLLVNTLLEMPADDKEINHRVSEMFQRIEKDLCTVLVEAQQDGTLAVGARPESVAKLLLNGIFGLQVYHKMQPDQEGLSQIVNNLLSVLEKQV